MSLPSSEASRPARRGRLSTRRTVIDTPLLGGCWRGFRAAAPLPGMLKRGGAEGNGVHPPSVFQRHPRSPGDSSRTRVAWCRFLLRRGRQVYADGPPSAVADQLELDRLPWAMLTQRGEKVFDRVERPPGEPDEDVAG